MTIPGWRILEWGKTDQEILDDWYAGLVREALSELGLWGPSLVLAMTPILSGPLWADQRAMAKTLAPGA